MLFYKLAEVCLQPIIPPKHSPPSLPYPLLPMLLATSIKDSFLVKALMLQLFQNAETLNRGEGPDLFLLS